MDLHIFYFREWVDNYRLLTAGASSGGGFEQLPSNGSDSVKARMCALSGHRSSSKILVAGVDGARRLMQFAGIDLVALFAAAPK
jgi:hypothetical protein